MDKIWKKSYLAKSLCGWCSCSCDHVRFSLPGKKKGKKTHSPEVIHQQVKDAQNHHQHNRTPLGLESHHYHHTRHKPKQTNHHPPKPPLPCKHKPHKQKNQQHPSRKLKIHLSILLIHLRQSGRREFRTHPAVAKNHKEPAHDAEVAQEEVEVENEAVAESLGDDNADKAEDGAVGMFAYDDKSGADDHGNDIDKEEGVC